MYFNTEARVTRELAQFACPVFGVQVSSYSHPWGHSALLVTRDRVSRRRAKIYGYRERRVEVRQDERATRRVEESLKNIRVMDL